MRHISDKKFLLTDYVGTSFLLLIVLLSTRLLSACSTLPLKPMTPVKAVTHQALKTDKLVFIVESQVGKQKHSQIMMSSLDGSHAKVLLDTTGIIFSLSASSDGKRLIYTHQSGKNYPLIYQLDIANRQTTVISPKTANNFGASLSPDGKQLLYASSVMDNPEIYLADMSEMGKPKNPQRLTFNPSADIAPVWLADGQSFVFTSDRQGEDKPQLYRYQIDTQQTLPLKLAGNYNAIARTNFNNNLISFVTTKGQGRLLDMASKSTIEVDTHQSAEPINFSSDGQAIIYVVDNQIILQNIEPLAQVDKVQSLKLGAKKIITLTDIMPANKIEKNSRIREPIWLSSF